MRIVHVNLAKGFRGGERQTQLLIQGLAEAGAREQVLVCRKDSPLRKELWDTPGLAFRSARHMFGGHKKIPDAGLVHAHEGKAAHWAFMHFLIHRTPYIITRRVPNPLKSSLYTQMVYKKAARLVAISSSIQDYLGSYVPSQTIDRIPSAWTKWTPQPPKIAKLQCEYGQYFVIGHVGALMDRHKGQRHLIEAARYFQDRYPQMRFLFLGSGPDRELLSQMAADCSNVEFLGFQKDVGAYLALMDLFVFPSNYEGLGSTLLDAMGFEVPVIASAVGGIVDIVQHEKTGLLISPGSPQSIIEAIEKLYQYPEKRKQLATKAKAQLAVYAPEEMVKRYQDLYQSLGRQGLPFHAG